MKKRIITFIALALISNTNTHAMQQGTIVQKPAQTQEQNDKAIITLMQEYAQKKFQLMARYPTISERDRLDREYLQKIKTACKE